MHIESNSQHFQDHQQLNYLLDYSDILQSREANHSYDLSISKDKLNLSEKERTREQSYEDICKQINQAKLQQVQLNQQLQKLKQETYKKYLGPFRQEFQQLNKQNLNLRAELNQYRRKIKEDKNQRLSNRSSVKPRTSTKSIYADQNSKTHTKGGRKQASPNILLKKKQIKITESSANLGRSQIVSPRVHRRRQSQLTQRKNQQQNNSMGVSVNASYYDQKNSAGNMRQSISKTYLKQDIGRKNIFIEILQKMLVQERIRDKEKYCELYLQVNESKSVEKVTEQVKFINQLQQEIQVTNEKLQMLTIVMNKYQSQMQGIDVNLKCVQEVFKKLYSVKGRFVEMQRKCSGLLQLRTEVNERQQFLDSRKNEARNEGHESANNNITSVQTMIKIITNNPNKSFKCKPSSLYFNYCRQIKELFKQNMEQQVRRQNKMLKVREMIESIRQGRKKFNELIQIYEARIAKLEEKIGRAKGQHLLRSDKSSRK